MDTSALYVLFNDRDSHHKLIMQTRDADPGPYVVPAGILSEIAYMAESALRSGTLETFLLDLEEGNYVLDCGEEDFARIRRLVRRYHDLSLGFADASVVACAERNGGQVLTLDHRHFGVVARGEGTITVLPATL